MHTAYCFTLNNPTVSGDDYALVLTGCTSYFTFQLERGANGTPHFQGYLEFGSRKRLATVKRLIGDSVHLEPRRGTQAQAIAYAQKEDTREGGPWEGGEKAETHQGRRTDLTAAVETLRTSGLAGVREAHPETYVRNYRGLQALAFADVPKEREPPLVVLAFGPAGVGKTRWFYDNYPADSVSIPCGSGFWFDGYEGQRHVLLDDFDGRVSKWTLVDLLRVLDRYPLRVPIKGGFVPWIPRTIFLTTNYHPRDWYDWTSREQQWPSLKRRIHRVLWWKSFSEPKLDLKSTDTTQWDHFWRGSQGAQDMLDAQSGRLVSRTAGPDNYFNY